MARVKWSERPRTHRGAIIAAFAGMAIAAVVVFEYAFYGSTLDRYLIMVTGLLVGGAVGALLAKASASR